MRTLGLLVLTLANVLLSESQTKTRQLYLKYLLDSIRTHKYSNQTQNSVNLLTAPASHLAVHFGKHLSKQVLAKSKYERQPERANDRTPRASTRTTGLNTHLVSQAGQNAGRGQLHGHGVLHTSLGTV